MGSSGFLRAHAVNGDRCPKTEPPWPAAPQEKRKGLFWFFVLRRGHWPNPQGFGDLRIGERMPEHTPNSESEVSEAWRRWRAVRRNGAHGGPAGEERRLKPENKKTKMNHPNKNFLSNFPSDQARDSSTDNQPSEIDLFAGSIAATTIWFIGSIEDRVGDKFHGRTFCMKIKFPTKMGIGFMKSDQQTTRQCHMLLVKQTRE
ncbi:hypothetical protein CXB51_029748 [Gossypium anomalum]|uniref:Uncharacterized protein n=1 Tax=Gossypium anomalum TaxID=47600 RepID=A0A8J5YHQ1_9ROSI|nr:hypothetical protein CXB51_029748 [Gossypium anomalum]